MQMGILHGKVEPDHPERNPARQEANYGRGVAELVSVPEESYEGNPHVRFCEEEEQVIWPVSLYSTETFKTYLSHMVVGRVFEVRRRGGHMKFDNVKLAVKPDFTKDL